MYGKTVLGIPGDRFEEALDGAKAAAGVDIDADLGAGAWIALVDAYKAVVLAETGRPSRRTRGSSFDLAVRAVFASWNTDRAVAYRRQ